MTDALFLSVLRIEPRVLVYVVSLALVTALLCVHVCESVCSHLNQAAFDSIILFSSAST